MLRKIGVILAISLMVAVSLLPLIPSAEAEMEIGSGIKKGYYISGLNQVEEEVYVQVDQILTQEYNGNNPRDSIDFSIEFPSVIFEGEDAEENAATYVKNTINKVLTIKYYSDLRAIWLWTYPVSHPDINVVVEDANLTSETQSSTVKVPVSCSFTLSVDDRFKGNIPKTINDVLNATYNSDSTDAIETIRGVYSMLSSVDVIDDEEGKISTVYDALVDKKSSSAGIATAFRMMVTKSNNIGCVVVTGMSYADSSEGKVHFWNQVEYNNKWYIVDATLSDCLMLGYDDTVVGEPVTSVLHNTSVQGLTYMSPPDVTRDSYEFPDERTFLDKYGSYFIVVAIVCLIVICLLMAVKQGLA